MPRPTTTSTVDARQGPADLGGERVPVAYGPAAERHDPVAGAAAPPSSTATPDRGACTPSWPPRTAQTRRTTVVAPPSAGMPTAMASTHEQQERQHDVHDHAGDDHHGALAGGLPVEGARLVGRVDLLQRRVADDLHEAAERDRLDAVLGLSPAPRPQCGAEAHEELRRLHPEPLGGQEVPGLVQDHRDEEGDDEGRDTEEVGQPAVSSRARVRAHPSAASTSSRVSPPRLTSGRRNCSCARKLPARPCRQSR